MSVLDEAVDKVRRWKDDWPRMVCECFGKKLDPWQEEFLWCVPRRKRKGLKCSKGVGKSFAFACAAVCFVATRRRAQVAVTSISDDNLKDGLWKEICTLIEDVPFLKAAFSAGKERVECRESPHNWWISKRTWSKDADESAQSKTLAGLHAEHMMFILDEIAGYPAGILPTAEGVLATGGDTHILAGGNATDPSGPLYEICTTLRDLWDPIEVNGDPDSPKCSPRVDKEWAREQIATFGRDNPWVKVNVLNEFPPSGINQLLGPDDVQKAMQRTLREDQFAHAQKRLGVDVAREGDDRTVIFARQGLMTWVPVVMRGARTNEVTARLVVAKKRFGSELDFIDNTGGFGSGVVDNMIDYGYSPVAVNASEAATDERYFNKRSEMHFELAEWVKRGGVLPNDPELSKELTAPTYTLFKGKLRIEEKEQIKKRLRKSPDKADALMQTFALPEMPASGVPGIPGQGGFEGNVESRYDPLDPRRWRAAR